jgi:hypothetical protein
MKHATHPAADLTGKGALETSAKMLEPAFIEQEDQALRGGSLSQQGLEGREIATKAAEIYGRQVEDRVVALAGGKAVTATCKQDHAGPDFQNQIVCGW